MFCNYCGTVSTTRSSRAVHHAASIVRWLFLSLPSVVRYTHRTINSTGSRKRKMQKGKRDISGYARVIRETYHIRPFQEPALLSMLLYSTCNTTVLLYCTRIIQVLYFPDMPSPVGVRISCPIFRYSYGPPPSIGAPHSLASDVCSAPCGLRASSRFHWLRRVYSGVAYKTTANRN